LLSSSTETDEIEPVGKEGSLDFKRLREQPSSLNQGKVLLLQEKWQQHWINKSIREALYLLGAVADALGHDIQELPLSHSSVTRMQCWEEFAIGVRKKCTPCSCLVVHWDGKLLPDITGKETVDMLPVIVSGFEREQLLGVRKSTSGTREAHRQPMYYDTLMRGTLVNS